MCVSAGICHKLRSCYCCSYLDGRLPSYCNSSSMYDTSAHQFPLPAPTPSRPQQSVRQVPVSSSRSRAAPAGSTGNSLQPRQEPGPLNTCLRRKVGEKYMELARRARKCLHGLSHQDAFMQQLWELHRLTKRQEYLTSVCDEPDALQAELLRLQAQLQGKPHTDPKVAPATKMHANLDYLDGGYRRYLLLWPMHADTAFSRRGKMLAERQPCVA